MGEAVGDAVVGQLARRPVEAVAVDGVGPGDLPVRPLAPGEHRGAVDDVAEEVAVRGGARERCLGLAQRAGLLARRMDRDEGAAVARLADDDERVAVVADGVMAEGRAVEDEALEPRLGVGPVRREVRGERREAVALARQAGEDVARRRGDRLDVRPLDHEVAGAIRRGRPGAAADAEARREARHQGEGGHRADRRGDQRLGYGAGPGEARPVGKGEAWEVHCGRCPRGSGRLRSAKA